MKQYWIIVKHADAAFNRNRRWSLDDSIYGTHTSDQLKLPRFFTSQAEAEQALKKVRSTNPQVSYNVVKVSR